MSKAKQLTAFLAERQRAPFSWAGGNCGHFAAAWMKVAEGLDAMAGLPVTPNKKAAERLVRRRGGYAALVSRQLGRDPIGAAFAQLGDLVLLPLPDAGPDAKALGVCAGAGMAAFVTEHGDVAYLALARAECAWRVGR